MFSLPRQNESVEATYQGRKSYFPGRNMPEAPFRQYSTDGSTKKEFLPARSSGPDESVSDEIKLMNWGNMQGKLTAQNLDDMARDLLELKSSVLEEKEKISVVDTKLGLLNHLLTDVEEIKEAVANVAKKTELRLEKLEELIRQTQKLKKRAPGISPEVYALATQGNVRKSTERKIERSWSFGMFSIPEQNEEKPEFDFGQSDAEFQEVKEWIGHFKSFKPALEPSKLL